MNCRLLFGFAFGVVFTLSTCAFAADPAAPSISSKSSSGKAEEAKPEMVELFAAAAKGDIDVKLIMKDSTTGQVIVTNKTKKPLTIQLPEVFAGVPVHAQLGGVGGGLGGNNNNNNQNQGVGGGGFGGGGFGGGGGGFGGGGGGLFNVGPEKVGKLKIKAVCLDHGKADPNPRIPYEMRPIESYVSKGEVIEVVKMLGKGEMDQASAQAATWHLNNGLSWNELASKIGIKHLNGTTEPYFTQSQLEVGLAGSKAAAHRAEELAKKQPAAPATKSLSGKE